MPNHGYDGGEEAEIGGCYVIGNDGAPYRVGLTQANEFSDHVYEAKNYLYLASVNSAPARSGRSWSWTPISANVPGKAMIRRGDETNWSAPLASGEKVMCHTLANLEHHHFKHAEHRRPGDAHVHFFGADMFSFKDRLKLENGDVMDIRFDGFGRALRNPVRIDRSTPTLVKAKPL